MVGGNDVLTQLDSQEIGISGWLDRSLDDNHPSLNLRLVMG